MAITVENNHIKIRGSEFVSHECEMSRIPVLYSTLHRIAKTVRQPTVEIFFSDGEPISAMNVQYMLDGIIHLLGITRDHLVIGTHDRDFNYPGARIDHISSPGLVSAIDCLDPWPNPTHATDAKRFGATFGRFSIDRLVLAAHLGTLLREKSFLIFNPARDWVDAQLQDLKNYYAHEMAWYDSWTNPHSDLTPNAAGSVCHYGRLNLTPYLHIWPRYHIEIVAETNIHSPYFVTEKTTRCLLTRKPFVLYGARGSLAHLRELGFRTFQGSIDESYDDISDNWQRLDCVKHEITRLGSLNDREHQQMLTDLDDVLRFNQDNYKRIARNYFYDFPH